MQRTRKAHLWLARLTAGASVLFTACVIAIWIFSYSRCMQMNRLRWELTSTEDWWIRTRILISRGRMMVHRQEMLVPAFVGNFVSPDAPFSNNRTRPSGVEWDWRTSEPIDLAHGARWVQWVDQMPPPPNKAGFVTVPLGLIALVATLVAGIGIYWWRRLDFPFRRWGTGHCPTCGYDIRATPLLCPECGTSLAGASGHGRDGHAMSCANAAS